MASTKKARREFDIREKGWTLRRQMSKKYLAKTIAEAALSRGQSPEETIVDNVDKTKSEIKLDSLKEDVFDPTSQASNKNQTLEKKQVCIKKEYSDILE